MYVCVCDKKNVLAVLSKKVLPVPLWCERDKWKEREATRTVIEETQSETVIHTVAVVQDGHGAFPKKNCPPRAPTTVRVCLSIIYSTVL